nr:unnamed protein product [Callosobruchus chinensis]
MYKNQHRYSGSTLLSDLWLEESTGQFKNFVRMSSENFEILINLIGPKVENKNTRFQEAIPFKERLATTMRFLATGDSYTSLQYLLKVSKELISQIVPELTELWRLIVTKQMREKSLRFAVHVQLLEIRSNCVNSTDR